MAFSCRQVQFNKTRENEEEEGKLREEVKSIDQQIKKLRQSSKSSSKQGDEIQALADARRQELRGAVITRISIILCDEAMYIC